MDAYPPEKNAPDEVKISKPTDNDLLQRMADSLNSIDYNLAEIYQLLINREQR